MAIVVAMASLEFVSLTAALFKMSQQPSALLHHEMCQAQGDVEPFQAWFVVR